jgi:hypothetical protein
MEEEEEEEEPGEEKEKKISSSSRLMPIRIDQFIVDPASTVGRPDGKLRRSGSALFS